MSDGGGRDEKKIFNANTVHQTVKLASQNVITPGTLTAYQRYAAPTVYYGSNSSISLS